MVVDPSTHKAAWKFRQIMAQVLPDGPAPTNQCILWPRTPQGKGYPRKIRVAGKAYNPLRLSWITHNKQPWPEGKVADHRCRTRACVNPHHIQPVTDFQNKLYGEQGAILFQNHLLGFDLDRKEWPSCPVER